MLPTLTISFDSPKLLLVRVFVTSPWSDSGLLPNSLSHSAWVKCLTIRPKSPCFWCITESVRDTNGRVLPWLFISKALKMSSWISPIWAKCWFVAKITGEDCRDGDFQGFRNESGNLLWRECGNEAVNSLLNEYCKSKVCELGVGGGETDLLN